MKNKWIYVAFLILAASMLAVYPKEGKFQYNYRKGQPWMYETLVSPFDFPILKTDDEMREEMDARASAFLAYYVQDSRTAGLEIDKFNEFAKTSELDAGITKKAIKCLNNIYTHGVVADFPAADISDRTIYIKRSKTVTEVPAEEVYNLESAAAALKEAIQSAAGDNLTPEQIDAIRFSNFIVPNLNYDEEATKIVQRDAVHYISPSKGIVYSGQLIVSNGEAISAEIYQILNSFKAEYLDVFGYTGSVAALWMNHIAMVLMMIFILFISIYIADRSIFLEMNKLIFILLLEFISFLSVALTFRVNQHLLYLLPVAVLSLYGSAFFKDKFVITIYTALLLPLAIIPENGLELFILGLVAGVIGLSGYFRFRRGWRQFINSVLIFAGMILLYVAFHITDSNAGLGSILKSKDVIFLGLNAIMTIVLYPFVLIFERLFHLVSYSRLRDLADTGNPILKELQRVAPGTFQHSLQVANLAEGAARRIGANDALIRVGALYHDIGKTENPMCFIENQAEGIEFHKSLTPEESARAIIRHVSAGMVLAAKETLPTMVSDFILTHHGNSRTEYFYNVYCNNGGNPSNTRPFTYNGKLPQTKEQVILMIADAVEAASRTLRNYSEESISSLVEKIVQSKMDAGQFVEADISFKEIDAVKEFLKSNLLQIYHARIAYPKRQIQEKGQAD